MSWTDLHARTEILHAVLARAAVDPANPALLHDLPDSERLFGGPEGVLAALRYRWDNHLRAKLDQALSQGQSAAEAYLELAAEQPVLRAVLDYQDARRWQADRVPAC
ncbi:hypothetical protein NDR87_21700 [Nocardia sp. CDC159]|uniref:Uncharacterized protein n=1 Tax=Nocardia pulmonis TaxID=2951408 RepID=A0A9X2J129_9NOCA|nr:MULTISPECIES: hypothetical protein [Nocardia]MCM6776561.1 hypothetical protein [Nocardia pulmonis]MCM6788985.1 hypothetical protein [Nocardia sp. CDC159]